MVWKGKERILEKKIAELKKLRSLPAKTTESISWYCDLDARLQSLLELGASEESLGSMALGRDVVKTLIDFMMRSGKEKTLVKKEKVANNVKPKNKKDSSENISTKAMKSQTNDSNGKKPMRKSGNGEKTEKRKNPAEKKQEERIILMMNLFQK